MARLITRIDCREVTDQAWEVMTMTMSESKVLVEPRLLGKQDHDNERLDRCLVRLTGASRAKAQQWLASERIFWRLGAGVPWQRVAKPSFKVPMGAQLACLPDDADRFVSRGGLKLQAALSALASVSPSIALEDAVALDVGQSTGGFTDCLLQAGVRKVVGVDVGHGQLDDRLREDARVVCMEKINARALPHDALRAEIAPNIGFDVAVMDVSFISQRLILPNLVPLLRPEGWLVSLVKPQFEVGKAQIGKGGIVSDSQVYPQLQAEMTAFCESLGLQVRRYQESPITGGDGNREFLLIGQTYPQNL